jgi:hypothetical protein
MPATGPLSVSDRWRARTTLPAPRYRNAPKQERSPDAEKNGVERRHIRLDVMDPQYVMVDHAFEQIEGTPTGEQPADEHADGPHLAAANANDEDYQPGRCRYPRGEVSPSQSVLTSRPTTVVAG